MAAAFWTDRGQAVMHALPLSETPGDVLPAALLFPVLLAALLAARHLPPSNIGRSANALSSVALVAIVF
jgi:hypothetical protein